jgi:hypothetical protein
MDEKKPPPVVVAVSGGVAVCRSGVDAALVAVGATRESASTVAAATAEEAAELKGVR